MAETNFTLRFGDKFGDGWNDVKLFYLVREYNSSYVVTSRDFMDLDDDHELYPEIGHGVYEGSVRCADDEAIYFAMMGADNRTLLMEQDPPMQSWEIYFQVEFDSMIYHGGWNTLIALTCDENRTLLSWTENLLEPLTSCPECAHPKPKPKPKPKPQHRVLGQDDDHKLKSTKNWPFPIKLMDPSDRDGWFVANTMAYAEYTISDASRTNLLAEGTLCAARGSDGYKTVCENSLPDGHYIFRAAGNLDEFAANYTWQLCGKDVKSSKDDDDHMNKTNTYDGATGRMGNEVSFFIKKGKCIVDEVVTVEDYANGTALDSLLTLDGHILLENVHFDILSPAESSILEADVNEFISLNIEKTVAITSVQDMNDGTLIGFRLVGSHAESQLMRGSMDNIVEIAAGQLQTQISGGGFLNYLHNGLEIAGLDDDKLMTVTTASFVDLNVVNLVTLRNGKTMSGDIVAGGDHINSITPVLSGDMPVSDSSSSFVLDVITACGAFAVVAAAAAMVILSLKPNYVHSSKGIDNSSTNLVKGDVDVSLSLDNSSAPMITSPSEPSQFSYENSLSAALTQRWERSNDDFVNL